MFEYLNCHIGEFSLQAPQHNLSFWHAIVVDCSECAQGLLPVDYVSRISYMMDVEITLDFAFDIGSPF
jgi:hypothetical protein